jgi:hypothetical protein
MRSASCSTVAGAVLCLYLVGCASPGSSITQTVRVETPGCATARCELQNDRGRWLLASTPGVVTLTTSDAPLQVSCRAADGAAHTVGATGSSRALTGGGAVVGGLSGGAAVGVTLGATALAFIPVLGIIAVATGAAAGALTGQAVESHARALSYADPITVPMRCPAADAGSGPGALPYGIQVRGLTPTESASAGPGEQGAVLVTSVTLNGRADIAGLRRGDLILSANGRDLNGAALFEEDVRAAAGAPIPLKIRRDGQMQTLVLAPGSAAP